eukprot:6483816-Prymnesium_polylepis.1
MEGAPLLLQPTRAQHAAWAARRGRGKAWHELRGRGRDGLGQSALALSRKLLFKCGRRTCGALVQGWDQLN